MSARRKQTSINTAFFALFTLATAVSVGCGDDADDPSTSPAKGGSAGKGGSGGSTAGSAGKGGTGGTAGSAGEDGVAGDEGTAGDEGVGGASGGQGGAAPQAFAPITAVDDALFTEFHDLRGLTYAKDDGKIYASGYRNPTYGSGSSAVVPVDREIVVARFTADGELDDTFNDDGVATFNIVARETELQGGGGAGGAPSEEVEVIINDGNEDSIGLIELDNGDLVVQVGLRGETGAGQDVGLLKLDDNGDPVAAFGNARGQDGLIVVDFGWTDAAKASASDTAWGVELDSSGAEEKLVISGFGPAAEGELDDEDVQRTDNDRYVVRLMADDGTIDPDFNGGTIFSYNSLGTFADNARRPLVEDDGAIMSSGYTNFGAGLENHIMLIRLLPDGTPDPDFGFGIVGDGVARANPYLTDGGAAEVYSVAKQASGRYVTTGYGEATGDLIMSSYGWVSSTAQDLVSFGVLPGGIDTTYGVQGNVAIQSEEAGLTGTEDRGRDLLVLPDQRIVQVGRFGDAPAIFVQLPDGQIDTAVGTMGRFMYDALVFTDSDGVEPLLPPTSTSHFYNVALSPDGKRIAATTNNSPLGVRLAILEVAE
ncbi:MAG TPA: hypothetical protein VM686_22795 [Polyangiaceae bacterium]|nr:hypothetical protein [Polyangiaceae bacterium]